MAFDSIGDRKTLAITLILVALLSALGCASSGPDPGETPSGPSVLADGRQVDRITVLLGSGVSEDMVQAAGDTGLVADLEAGVGRALGPSRKSDYGTLSLDVEVVDFRVRSTASAIWWGVFAGADRISVQVRVNEGGQTLKTYTTGTSTSLGGFAYGSRAKRVTRMLDTLSKRIVAGL